MLEKLLSELSQRWFVFCHGWLAHGHQKEKSYPSPCAGDTSTVAGPLATDLSPSLTARNITKAMRKVGDWELAHPSQYFSQDWTFAAFYRGFLAAGWSLPDRHYIKAMLAVGKI